MTWLQVFSEEDKIRFAASKLRDRSIYDGMFQDKTARLTIADWWQAVQEATGVTRVNVMRRTADRQHIASLQFTIPGAARRLSLAAVAGGLGLRS